jgi:hypothetical protein
MIYTIGCVSLLRYEVVVSKIKWHLRILIDINRCHVGVSEHLKQVIIIPGQLMKRVDNGSLSRRHFDFFSVVALLINGHTKLKKARIQKGGSTITSTPSRSG